MPLTNSNNYLQSLISAGADALNNLYIVSFDGGHLTEVDNALKVRCTGFTAPAITHDSYTVRFVNAFIDRPTAKVNVTRNFTLTFRVDANFEAYKALLEQEKVTFNPTQSFTATDINTLKENNRLFNVTVDVVNQGINSETIETTTLYRFRNCWITNIPSINYSTETAAAATITVSISFLEMEDLQSGISGVTQSPNVVLGWTD